MLVQIKRNSREFKDLKEVISDLSDKTNRKRFLFLYALKDGTDIGSRILISKEDKTGVVYDLTLQNVHSYLRDTRKKLFREERSAIYFFKNSAGSDWMEFPFELRGTYKKQVMPLRVVKGAKKRKP